MASDDVFATPGAKGPDIDESGIQRDRWKRPVIEGQGYTRATTLAETMAERWNLEQWQLRMVAKGMATGPDDLIKLASVSDPDSGSAPGTVKFWKDEIVEPALERAGAGAGAKRGTALHLGTHRFDRDGWATPLTDYPAWARQSLAHYAKTMMDAGITIDPGHIEIFTVADDVESAGTADRLLDHPSWPQMRVGDLKTQKDHPKEWNALQIAVQLAVYAHGLNTRGIWRVTDRWTGAGHWDTSTVGRVDTERAVIIWLPVEGKHAGTCELIEIDLVRGWMLARMSERVRHERKAAPSLVRPLTFDVSPIPTGPSAFTALVAEEMAQAPSVLDRIPRQTTADRIDAAFPLETHSEFNVVAASEGRPAWTDNVPNAEQPKRPRRTKAQLAAAGKLADERAAGCNCDADEHLGVIHAVAPACPVHGESVPEPSGILAVYSLTQLGVKYQIEQYVDCQVSKCLECPEGTAMTAAGDVDGQAWRTKHAQYDHAGIVHHGALEEAQKPVQGPALEAVAHQILDRLHDDRMASVDPFIALRAKIKQAKSPAELSALWAEHSTIWTDELTRLGQETLAALPA